MEWQLDDFFFLWESAIFHLINLPFDAQVAEKIINVIYNGHPLQIHLMYKFPVRTNNIWLILFIVVYFLTEKNPVLDQ